ncbi:MAG: hypothetical protein KGI33_01715 [Thaumarchaeota archaeon]|nr:hypothetical protein [Nitrososphaerota archaeon]
MADQVRVNEMKKKITQIEKRLQKIVAETEGIWEETGLDPKDPSYLVEKTMRFELAKKTVDEAFLCFKDLVETYKSICRELEEGEQE